MAPKKKLLRKKRRLQEEGDSAEQPESKGHQAARRGQRFAAAGLEAPQGEEMSAEPSSSSTAGPAKRKAKKRKEARPDKEAEQKVDEEEHEVEDVSQPQSAQEEPGGEAKDMRGIIHLATLPLCMRVQKLRHLMEQYGEIGRIYLAPEDKFRHTNRKRAGGNRKLRYTEGWVEFADRRVAKRVALTLNGSTIGGKKRHNFFRDDMWNMRYLPRFKWHMMKEGSIYNQQVRKARLQQRLSQAARENTFYLEKVEQAKTQKKIAERRASKGAAVPSLEPRKLPRTSRGADVERSAPAPPSGAISDRVLNSLL